VGDRVKELPTAERLLADSDITHYVCCEDTDLAFCGIDASGFTWDEPTIVCVVCDDLDSDDGYCPKGKRCYGERV
jgi:hypothetical protein